jgi:hypothetical protein
MGLALARALARAQGEFSVKLTSHLRVETIFTSVKGQYVLTTCRVK